MRADVARYATRPFLPLYVDLLWLRTLNAIGLTDSASKNRALYEYGRAITDLDPRFKTAYEYIGINIPYALARDTFSGGDLAADLLRRGLVHFPRDMKLHMYLGFSLFHHQRKYSEAADVFMDAAKLPDALPFMAPLAARLKAHGGDARAALDMAQALLDAETDDAIRADLAARMASLQVEVVLQDVEAAAVAFHDKTGRYPKDIAELRLMQLYHGSDLDPSGGTISLDDKGKATSTSIARRYEIYE